MRRFVKKESASLRSVPRFWWVKLRCFAAFKLTKKDVKSCLTVRNLNVHINWHKLYLYCVNLFQYIMNANVVSTYIYICDKCQPRRNVISRGSCIGSQNTPQQYARPLKLSIRTSPANIKSNSLPKSFWKQDNLLFQLDDTTVSTL